MNDMLTFFVGRLGSLVSWLNSQMIVSGVSLLSFFGGLFLICLLIHFLLLRAR